MKRFILILMLSLIPVFCYSQDKKEANKEDVTVVINISKISNTLGKIVKFVANEAKQFKDEAVENMPDEQKENLKKAKENIKYELKYNHDAIHAGWAQGWRGEDYTPPYKHK